MPVPLLTSSAKFLSHSHNVITQLLLRWPRYVAQVKFSLLSGVPLFNAFFSQLSLGITINHILVKTRFFGLHFCRRQYGSNLTTVAEFGEITQK